MRRRPLIRGHRLPGQTATRGTTAPVRVQRVVQVGETPPQEIPTTQEDQTIEGTWLWQPHGVDGTTVLAVGDLNGQYGYIAATYGLGVGEYAASLPNITIDSINGLRIRLYDEDRITLAPNGTLTAVGLVAESGELQDLDVSGVLTLVTGGVLQSSNFVTGVSGFKIDTDGDAEFDNIIARGTFNGELQVLDLADVVTMTSTGAIQFGSGTWGVDFTGLRWYKAGSDFVFGGFKNEVQQAYFGTDGKLYGGAGAVSMDVDGFRLQAAGLLEANRSVRFFVEDYAGADVRQTELADAGYADLLQIGVIAGTGGASIKTRRFQRWWNAAYIDDSHHLHLLAEHPDSAKTSSQIDLWATDSYGVGIEFTPNEDATLGFKFNGSAIFDGSVRYTGTLESYKNSTAYEVVGAKFLTTQLTSTSWDSDAKSSANNGTLDLSALFGAPAGIKAVLVGLTIYSTTGDINVTLKPDSDASNAPPLLATTVASKYVSTSGWVPCDANGDIYFSSSSATSANVWIDIWGYAL